MSSKKSKQSASQKTRTKAKAASGAKAEKRPSAGTRARSKAATTSAGASTTEPGVRSQRLPPVGTLVKKLDRYGNVRCECTIEEGGAVRYNGEVYRSISAAAMAAAKDLGLENKTQNGYTFWHLEPARTSNLLGAMELKGRRFEEAAGVAVAGVTAENRGEIEAALQKYRESIDTLLAKVAS